MTIARTLETAGVTLATVGNLRGLTDQQMVEHPVLRIFAREHPDEFYYRPEFRGLLIVEDEP